MKKKLVKTHKIISLELMKQSHQGQMQVHGGPMLLEVDEEMQSAFDRFVENENYEACEGMIQAFHEYKDNYEEKAVKNFKWVDPFGTGGHVIDRIEENAVDDLEDETCDQVFAHVQNLFHGIITVEEAAKMIKLALLKYEEERDKLGD